MNPPANTPIIPHVESGIVTNPTMNPSADTPIISHVESGGVMNPTFNVERYVVMNPPENTPTIPHMESSAVAIPKVDKDESVPVIEIKPTKKRRYGHGTSGDTVTKSCTCCPDDEYESDYYDK